MLTVTLPDTGVRLVRFLLPGGKTREEQLRTSAFPTNIPPEAYAYEIFLRFSKAVVVDGVGPAHLGEVHVLVNGKVCTFVGGSVLPYKQACEQYPDGTPLGNQVRLRRYAKGVTHLYIRQSDERVVVFNPRRHGHAK